jgi:arylsulfatase A-like enzyme
MISSRRAALLAAMVAATLDVLALRKAWATFGERLALGAAMAALAVGTALLAVPWLYALTAPWRSGGDGDARPASVGGWRAPLGRVAVALGGGLACGVALAGTHWARARLGPWATPAVVAAVAATWALLPSLARVRVGGRAWGRLLIAGAGVAALVANAGLPQRLYPSLRATLLTTGFVALACAFGAADERARPRLRASVGTVVAGALLLLGGRLLVDFDANTRFVARAQAPTAALVLDAVAMVQPFDARPLHAAHAEHAAGAALDPHTSAGSGFAGSPALPAAADALSTFSAEPPRLAALAGPAAFVRERRASTDAALGDAHVILITVDALRADRLRPERMPALAATAAHALRFERAYAAAPSTAASITTLLTAHHPSHLDARPQTIAEVARARGWLTAAFYPAGLFFDGGGALAPYADARFGFEWADTRTLPADALSDAVLARVGRVVAEGEPRTLLWAHYFDPHEPYERHGLPAEAPPLARYDAEVAAVDRALARLINGLTILQRPTLLIITGDHGEEFGEHGGAYHGSSLYDEQLRVPLVVTVLGRSILPAASIATPVSLADVAPTLAALVGLPPPDGDGRPLPPLDPGPRDVTATVQSRRMLLRAPWKLIHDQRRDIDELYELDGDPAEQHNIVDSRVDIGDELNLALARWWDQAPPSRLAARLGDRVLAPAVRAQAARELGEREVFAAKAALAAALDDGDAGVRAEAALALAQLSDGRARAPLRAIVDDALFGDRAALMLGRLRDAAAAPRLADICRRAFAESDAAAAGLHREAAHYLGFVGDRDSTEALWDAADDPRVRGAAYVALGRIAGRGRDRATAAALLDRFGAEDRDDARIDLAWALGLAGDARAAAALAAAAANEPPLPRASEALVRLAAVPAVTIMTGMAPATRAAAHPAPTPAKDVPPARLPATAPAIVGGVDLACRRAARPPLEAGLEEWIGATHCVLDAPLATLRALAPAGADVVVVRARALGKEAHVTISIDGIPLPPLSLGSRWSETRLVKPVSKLVKPIRIDVRRDGAPVDLDHVLILRDVTPGRL